MRLLLEKRLHSQLPRKEAAMREFVRRLLVPIACFAIVLAAGYPMLTSAPTAPTEAAGTGVALLALASVLRRSVLVAGRPAVGLVPQTAVRTK
jgi:hypothetical protein